MNNNDFDWVFVKEECPLAFKLFRESVYPNTSSVNKSILSLYHIKNLYYFFDSVGILLSVECLSENQWLGNIQLRSGFSFSVKGSHSSRIELEKEGFKECFVQLNNRLKRLSQIR